MEFFRIRNELRKNPESDTQPLKDITIGEAQNVEIHFLEADREEGVVQLGDTIYGVIQVGKARSEAGTTLLTVTVCTDSTDTDLVDSAGTSILGSDRANFVEWQIDAFGDGLLWKVGEISSERVEVCST